MRYTCDVENASLRQGLHFDLYFEYLGKLSLSHNVNGGCLSQINKNVFNTRLLQTDC